MFVFVFTSHINTKDRRTEGDENRGERMRKEERLSGEYNPKYLDR